MQAVKSEICHYCRIKKYPDGTREYMASKFPIFREKGWEFADDWGTMPDFSEKSGADVVSNILDTSPENLERSRRRARARVYDYCMCNPFRYFITLTLDAGKIDRFDYGGLVKKLNQWLDNCVRRYGLKYVIVFEHHKDGALHMHGLINDALRVVDSGTLTGVPRKKKPCKPRSERQRQQWLAAGAHVVYNLPQWKYGFTTAIEIYGDYHKAVGYVCKYLSKEGNKGGKPQKIGGRWYLHGGALALPEVELLDAFSIDDVIAAGGVAFDIDGTSNQIALWRGGEDENRILARERSAAGSCGADAGESAGNACRAAYGAENLGRAELEAGQAGAYRVCDRTENRKATQGWTAAASA